MTRVFTGERVRDSDGGREKQREKKLEDATALNLEEGP